TLAFQRMRATWRMLCLVALGMLASVIIVCTVPLYSQVTMTAGLRAILTSYGQNADIVVRGSLSTVSRNGIDQLTRNIDTTFQRDLGRYLRPVQLSLQSPLFNIYETLPDGTSSLSGDQMGITGVDTAHAGPHMRFLQGRMPSNIPHGDMLEIALRPEMAAGLHWQLGTIIPVQVIYFDPAQGQTRTVLKLQVVGVFSPVKVDDPFFHGEQFLGSSTDLQFFIAGSLASNEALISLFSQTLVGGEMAMPQPCTLIWYYSLDTSHIQIGDMPAVLRGVSSVQVDTANDSLLNQQLAFQRPQTYAPSDALNQYASRLPIAQFPITSLLILVLCLTLFFITLMTGILVDRQVGSLALLRSRGASSGQIFASLVTQAILLGLLALVAGPLLALPLTRFLAQHLLASSDQGSLNTLDGNPLSLTASVGIYALITVGALVVMMILAIWGTSSRDVLALRRETARSTHRPLWQRLNLDTIGILVALIGAGFSLYLANSRVLDTRLFLLFLSPLTLIEALCLLLAAMLLLIRFFPLLLHLGALLSIRLRGAASLLALAQMSRSPRQSVRMTLLLALATAFAIFTLLFNATQIQRVQDMADFQAMADFSGNVPAGVITPQQLTSMTQTYKRLPGVQAASLGYVKKASAGGEALNLSVDFKAIDANTFLSTAIWPAQDSDQPLASLLQQLTTNRNAFISKGVVPAVVDNNAWDTLHLSPGARFTLNFSQVSASDLVHFQVVARVPYIPTSGNSGTPGVLADYSTFVNVYTHNFTLGSGYAVPLNYVWLRTNDNAAQLKALRQELNGGRLRLSPLFDRTQMVQQLTYEPLYLTLFGILLLGAIISLLLALVGNLVASWLNTRARLANFAALRALGATPRQIAGTLAWEQVIIYSIALLLGFLAGWLLAVLALPSLVFTSVLPDSATGAVDSATFYAAQNTPPVRIMVPSALWIVLGGLVLLCIVALGMMVRIVSRPSIAQVLRLNED
ncbi:MAG TPA: FtsX-like permease family protein, partial [Ktedonobacteraceae bacterium]|nr:FtsX-like permease family protein [Ktedonobacteraceae bacterium]